MFANELGEPIRADHVQRTFKVHARAAGLSPTLHPHSLRHSAATFLLAAGVSETVTMRILGRANLAMTSHYQHLLSGMLTDAASKLDSVFPERPAASR